jgi:cytochrome c oxidase cbb3-type subunit 3
MVATAAIGAGATGWWMRSPTAGLPPSAAAVHGVSMQPAPALRVRNAIGMPARVATDPAGIAQQGGGPSNPLGDAPEARMAGHALYLQMNCAGCHGYHGEGNMGPQLSDKYWLYGGTPSAIYRTLALGRPKGMPAWGQALPPESLWQLVAFLQSMGGTVPPELADAERQGDFPDRGPARGKGGGPGAVGQSPSTSP